MVRDFFCYTESVQIVYCSFSRCFFIRMIELRQGNKFDYLRHLQQKIVYEL
jgi:hypothetical protein